MPLIFALQTSFGFALETLEVSDGFLGVFIDFSIKRAFFIGAVNDIEIAFYFASIEFFVVSLGQTAINNGSRNWFLARRTA